MPSRAGSTLDRPPARVIEQVPRHAGDEEARLFPALRTAAAPEELRALGGRARRTEAHSTGRSRRRPPAARPADRLTPPRRSFARRMRAFTHPGAPG
ncbi:hypothetical protein [Kitasatospora sp. NPDC057541]|uniref:hypothetical protein n=1 Tax=Kitasatospora sp. NPDC057541 TaxID=3346161 RepID=UPI0036A20BDA